LSGASDAARRASRTLMWPRPQLGRALARLTGRSTPAAGARDQHA